MVFRYYSNAISQATRGIATGILVTGLMLIGFGMLIAAMPEVFAYLAAGLFFLAGFGCALTALKIYWAQKRADRMDASSDTTYHNVRIHRGGFFEDV